MSQYEPLLQNQDLISIYDFEIVLQVSIYK